jgi:transposase
MQHLIPAAKSGGRPERTPKRDILNALADVARTGGAWRWLPPDVPPWPIVWHDVRRWRADGAGHHIPDLLRGDIRRAVGQHQPPSAGIIDRQAGKTTAKGGSAGTMRTRTAMNASATSLSTREADAWPSW